MQDLDYQVGASFKAIDEGVHLTALISTGYFLRILIFPETLCSWSQQRIADCIISCAARPLL